MKTDRLPPISPTQWKPAQRDCAQEIMDGPRKALVEPFIPMLRSPELCTHAQRLGEYLRYRSVIGLQLSELAILVTARYWSQQVEWSIHAPIAIREGIPEAVVTAIANGHDPAFEDPKQALVWTFSRQILTHQSVDDPTWALAIDAFGEQGAVDLLGVVGYYTMLSIMMNGSQTPPPAGSMMRLPSLAPGVASVD
jgi:4-carboxymuconolactone decarboxylase